MNPFSSNYNSYFLYSQHFNTFSSVNAKIMPQNVHKENVQFLTLPFTKMLLLRLLHNMQSSMWKLNGQYDYHKLECHQSLNTETLYLEH
jgi:hypothetical protein